MIKLERIYVKNYKNIAEADLELGNINVIVGENGSGKTNLLSVIPFLNYIINGPINEVREGCENDGNFPTFGSIRVRNDQHNNTLNPIIIKLDFFDNDRDILYSYETHSVFYKPVQNPAAQGGIVTMSMNMKIKLETFSYKQKSQTGKAIMIFKRIDNDVTYGSGIKKLDALINTIDEHTSVIRLLKLIKRSENITEEYKIALNNLDLIFGINTYYLSSQNLKLSEAELYGNNRILSFNLTNSIKTLLESFSASMYEETIKKVLNIDTIDTPFYYKSKSELGFFILITQHNASKTLHELSDGSLVLLALITKIFSDSSDIFFIEEPENSIHPRALYELMKLIREKSLDKQFIITTHSPYLLNMIKPEEVLVAEIQEDGLSKISKLPNVKAIKKKLAKSFMSFGDIVFAAPDTDDDSE